MAFWTMERPVSFADNVSPYPIWHTVCSYGIGDVCLCECMFTISLLESNNIKKHKKLKKERIYYGKDYWYRFRNN